MGTLTWWRFTWWPPLKINKLLEVLRWRTRIKDWLLAFLFLQFIKVDSIDDLVAFITLTFIHHHAKFIPFSLHILALSCWVLRICRVIGFVCLRSLWRTELFDNVNCNHLSRFSSWLLFAFLLCHLILRDYYFRYGLLLGLETPWRS